MASADWAAAAAAAARLAYACRSARSKASVRVKTSCVEAGGASASVNAGISVVIAKMCLKAMASHRLRCCAPWAGRRLASYSRAYNDMVIYGWRQGGGGWNGREEDL